LAAAGFDLKLLAFDDAELTKLLNSEPITGQTDEDDVPEPPKEAITQPGDLYLLGAHTICPHCQGRNDVQDYKCTCRHCGKEYEAPIQSDHRILCGDSTKPEDVQRLMNGEKADMVFSDPPYNVAYEGGTDEKMTIKNDAMSDADYIKFMDAFFARFREAVRETASMYICHALRWQMETEASLRRNGFSVRSQIIWVKNSGVFGFARYKFQHETIFYVYVEGESDKWYGDKTQTTVWLEKKPAANQLHPTMKPVEIVQRALVNSSKRGDLVLDLFMGSGTTLIAAQTLERRCYGMELDPIYADVIVKRWEEFTGKKAIRIREEVAAVQ
jgi:DNA modification methylase